MNREILIEYISELLDICGGFKLTEINEQLSIGGTSTRKLEIDSVRYYGVDIIEYDINKEYLSKSYYSYDIIDNEILLQIFFLINIYYEKKIL